MTNCSGVLSRNTLPRGKLFQTQRLSRSTNINININLSPFAPSTAHHPQLSALQPQHSPSIIFDFSHTINHLSPITPPTSPNPPQPHTISNPKLNPATLLPSPSPLNPTSPYPISTAPYPLPTTNFNTTPTNAPTSLPDTSPLIPGNTKISNVTSPMCTGMPPSLGYVRGQKWARRAGRRVAGQCRP